MNHPAEARPSILIIDDQPSNLLMLGNALEEEYELRIATSAAMGLELAESTQPALILLDVMMPQMDGFETCRLLRGHPQLASIPVIFLTAMSELGSESQGLKLGAVDYITKPIHVEIARQRIRNLVEREQLRKTAESSAKQIATRLVELKQQMLQNIRHELRSPLHAIIGLADVGQRTQELSKAHHLFEHIQHSGRRLLDVIGIVLDFGDATSNQLTIDPFPFDGALLLRQLAVTWQPRAAARGLRFRVTGIPEFSWICQGDARRLHQVLDQLLSNAVKFTVQGGVSLDVAVHPDRAQFCITDTGPGMTQEQLHKAFNPFEQADGSLSRRFGGIGLALPLVEYLVQQMRGTVQVNSTPGQGCRFVVDIPMPSLNAVDDAQELRQGDGGAAAPEPEGHCGEQADTIS